MRTPVKFRLISGLALRAVGRRLLGAPARAGISGTGSSVRHTCRIALRLTTKWADGGGVDAELAAHEVMLAPEVVHNHALAAVSSVPVCCSATVVV
eukprot:scaffold15759_cov112-Isochrysis_galbana.AAC.2